MYIRLIDGSILYFPEARTYEIENGALQLIRSGGKRWLGGFPLAQVLCWWYDTAEVIERKPGEVLPEPRKGAQ